MKKLLLKSFLGLLICSIAGTLWANVEWRWATKAGGLGNDYGKHIATDSSGNIYITGIITGGSATFGDITLSGPIPFYFIAKVDNAGNWLWAKSLGASTIIDDKGNGIAIDSSGNICITASFQGTTSFGNTTLTSLGAFDIVVAKLDNNGNWLWAKNASSTSDDQGFGIATDSLGNIFIIGRAGRNASFGGITPSFIGTFIAKLDCNGNWVWVKGAGGFAYGISTDQGGNICITGYFYGSANFGSALLTSAGSSDIFIAKLDNNGNWLWAKSGGGTDYDGGYGIATDSSGNLYITGSYAGTASFGYDTFTSAGSGDIFVAKLDSNGDWQWARSAGGPVTYSERGNGIAVDSSGNIYVTGLFYGTAIFGGNTLISSGSYNIFVAKLDGSGGWTWIKTSITTSNDQGLGIATDSSGNISITGYFFGTATYGNTTLTSTGGAYDVLVAEIAVNTPIGTDVSVAPLDTTTGTQPMSLTFASVSEDGMTILTTASTGPTPPSGFILGTPPKYFEITTTAIYTGLIQVCINYGDINYTNETELRLLHYENGQWVDVTTSNDIANKRICGSVALLSPFAIFEPESNRAPQAVCKDITLEVGPNCQSRAINPQELNGGSFDPDGDALQFTASDLGPFSPGIHQVSLTVADGKGKSSSCVALVTVVDKTAPIPDVQNLPTITGQCSAEITVPPTATDSCDGKIIGTTNDPLQYTNQGTYAILWTYTDRSGNATTQNQIIVVKDTIAPTINVSSPECVTYGTGKGNKANKITVTAQDNCSHNVALQIKKVEVFNNGGNLVNGNGIYEISGNIVYVNPNGNGWSVRITVVAADEYGNTQTIQFIKSLIKC